MLFIFDDFFSPRSITYVIVSLSLHSTYIIYMFGQSNFHFDFHLNDFHDFLPLPQKLKMPKRNTSHSVSLLLEGDAVDRDEILNLVSLQIYIYANDSNFIQDCWSVLLNIIWNPLSNSAVGSLPFKDENAQSFPPHCKFKYRGGKIQDKYTQVYTVVTNNTNMLKLDFEFLVLGGSVSTCSQTFN